MKAQAVSATAVNGVNVEQLNETIQHVAAKPADTSHGFSEKAHSLSTADFILNIIPNTFLGAFVSGQVLRVTSTDSGSIKDMEAFAKQTGNALLGSSQEGGDYVFFLKKK